VKILFRAIAIASTGMLTLIGFGMNTAGAATPQSGTELPQVLPAQAASAWLVSQFNSEGFIPTSPGSSHADLSSTAQSVLALSAANVDLSLARAAVSYLESHVNAYVTVDGADGPAQLALLILDATALGVTPQNFRGTDLVSRLLATEKTSGPDAGLFGTAAQVAGYSAGGYQQGLALAALAAAGVHGTSQTVEAANWLISEQCSDGGWTSPDNSFNSCTGLSGSFEGPDTNSTSLAVHGLAAQGALASAVSSKALTFLTVGQDSDAGWSFYPNTVATPGVSDPDSTALVIQSLLALGDSPAAFAKGPATPASALLSFQITSGTGAGAFYFPPAPSPANILSTYQAVPALEALSFPWGPSGGGYTEVGSDGGAFSFGNASYYGSMGGKTLDKPIVGIASTPDGKGYWEVASDGDVFSFGDASYYGSMGGKTLDKPIVGIASTADGRGYWEIASDGGVFSFGDASYFGSMVGRTLKAPVVGISSSPDGKGYWEVASDGGVFSFGDASYYGSMGGRTLKAPVVGITSAPDGKGYWEVASDGGVFSFGDATYFGSMVGRTLKAPVVGISSSPDGEGYWEVASDGGVFSFGDATYHGSMGGRSLGGPVVAIATGLSRPSPSGN